MNFNHALLYRVTDNLIWSDKDIKFLFLGLGKIAEIPEKPTKSQGISWEEKVINGIIDLLFWNIYFHQQ